MTINCSKCKEFLDLNRLGKQRYCKKCHAENMRENRRKYSELQPDARMKSIARSYVKQYIKRGFIKKQPCLVCGEKAEMHHDDYTKPLEVKWLCRDHHLELHGYPQK